MKTVPAIAALTLALGTTALPAFARDSYVADNAHLFSAAAISSINAKVSDFAATAHKEVFVDTETTVDGTPQAAAEAVFAKQQVNGVLIFIAKSPKTIGVVPDRVSSSFFPPSTTSAIRTAIKSGFNSGDYNGGINEGVDLSLSFYRSHLGALTHQKASYAPVGGGEVRSSQAGFFNMGFIGILIVLAIIFFVIRGIFRAMAGPRMMPPGAGYGGGGPMMGGGYGPGYGGGYGGGGGGFWSGLMGGLGGAFLGNELFGGGRRDDFGGNQAGFVDQGQSTGDASGFQGDAGQADMGNASFGGWGDGGGGGGGGDFGGGGGGGDFGGGDDSGGGW